MMWALAGRSYEELGERPTPFSGHAVRRAFERCGASIPAIVVHPINQGFADLIALHFACAVLADPGLNPHEWFVCHGQKQVGSIGAPA